MKIGLLLEGGAMRGMYTAGVIDVLLEKNIKADCIIGVSAGALFGINYKSRQKGRAYRSNMKYIKDRRYMGMYSLLTTGNIVNEEFCFYEIPDVLDDFNYSTFKKTKGDFYAVVTNMKSGKAEYVKIEDVKKDVEYLRASGSLPFVSRPVKIGENEYLDGGITDAIPIKKIMSMDLDKVIVVLTRPDNYRKSRSNMTLAKIKYRRYPKLVEAMSIRYKVYNKSLDEIEFLSEEKEIFVIRPSEVIKMRRLEKDEKILKSMYELGIKDAENSIEKLKEYLNN